MADTNAQPQPGSNPWEAEKARLEAQLAEKDRMLSGLSNERNSYRQRADAWEKKVGSKLGEMVKFDANGLPMDVDPGEEAKPVVNGQHPFTGVVENPAAIDQYFQNLLGQQGYLTTAQAQTWANTAAQ